MKVKLTSFIILAFFVGVGVGVGVGCDKKSKFDSSLFNNSTIVEHATEFDRIEMLKYDGSNIYGSDFSFSRLVKFASENWSDTLFLGREGNGPGEFNGVKYLDVINDSIYALVKHTSLHVFYKNGNYERTIELPKGILPGGRFTVLENSIVLFRRYHQYPFIEIDFNGNILNEFGRWKGDYSDPVVQFVSNVSNILYDKSNNQFLRVYKSIPVIEFYSRNGKYLGEVNLEGETLIKERYEEILKEKGTDIENQRSAYHLFEDISFINNKLALLIYQKDIGPRDIYIINILKKEIGEIKRYNFNKQNDIKFRTIELVTDSTIVAYGYSEGPRFFEIELH